MGDKGKKEKVDSKDSLFERYKMIVAARNFHYENFNKWMTYFYVATGAIFVGYITLITNSATKDLHNIQTAVLVLGYISGLVLYWSSKGYYFWNINFIMLVNHYEKDLLKWDSDTSIYSVLANKKVQNNYWSPVSGANISTSKIAILFAFLISIGWCTTLLFSVEETSSTITVDPDYLSFTISLFISVAITLALTRWLAKPLLKSKVNHMEDLALKQKQRK
tara:strand:+ start:2806 stop:3468 length:663 start_codon:yes stop_codon:yes gene_type:complete